MKLILIFAIVVNTHRPAECIDCDLIKLHNNMTTTVADIIQFFDVFASTDQHLQQAIRYLTDSTWPKMLEQIRAQNSHKKLENILSKYNTVFNLLHRKSLDDYEGLFPTDQNTATPTFSHFLQNPEFKFKLQSLTEALNFTIRKMGKEKLRNNKIILKMHNLLADITRSPIVFKMVGILNSMGLDTMEYMSLFMKIISSQVAMQS